MSKQELTQQLADLLVEEMKKEGEEIGCTLSDYDIDSFCDKLDDVSYEIQKKIQVQLNTK